MKRCIKNVLITLVAMMLICFSIPATGQSFTNENFSGKDFYILDSSIVKLSFSPDHVVRSFFPMFNMEELNPAYWWVYRGQLFFMSNIGCAFTMISHNEKESRYSVMRECSVKMETQEGSYTGIEGAVTQIFYGPEAFDNAIRYVNEHSESSNKWMY